MRIARTVFIITIALVAGAAIGYYFGYDHGWELAIQYAHLG